MMSENILWVIRQKLNDNICNYLPNDYAYEIKITSYFQFGEKTNN